MKHDIVWLLLLAGGLFAYRLFRRQASRAEVLTAVFCLLHGLIIQLQMVCDGSPVQYVDMRYHIPILAPVIALVSAAVVPLVGQCRRGGRVILLVALALLVIRTDYKVIKRERKYAHVNRAIAQAEEWAAQLVKVDYQGPKRCTPPYARTQYLSDQRPLVFEPQGRMRNIVKGRAPIFSTMWMSPEAGMRVREKPDYALIMRGLNEYLEPEFKEVGAVLLAQQVFGGHAFKLYRLP